MKSSKLICLAGSALDVCLSASEAGTLRHCVHILAGHNGFVLSLCTVGDVLFTGSQAGGLEMISGPLGVRTTR